MERSDSANESRPPRGCANTFEAFRRLPSHASSIAVPHGLTIVVSALTRVLRAPAASWLMANSSGALVSAVDLADDGNNNALDQSAIDKLLRVLEVSHWSIFLGSSHL